MSEDAKSKINVLRVSVDPSNQAQVVADLAAEGLFTNAVMMKGFSKNVVGDIDITEAMKSLRTSLEEVSRGELRTLETMLFGQAAALNSLFAELLHRSGANMGVHLDAADRYMRLALKAQGQCRATLETLATIKNPPVVFARQANINNGGQQQVNNGAQAPHPGPARAREGRTEPNEVMAVEHRHDEWLDNGAACQTGRNDQVLAAVGVLDRAENESGQGQSSSECGQGKAA